MTGRRLATRLAGGVAGLGLLVGTGCTVSRSLPGLPGVAPDTWAMATSFTDFGVLGYASALVGLGAAVALAPRSGRRRTLAVLGVTLALTALHLSWIAPRYVRDARPPAAGGSVRVLAQNTLFGGADPEALLAAGGAADVLVLTELTQPAADRLDARGIGRAFPFQAGGRLPATGAAGTRVYSRFPIRASSALDPGSGAANWVVELEVPDLGPLTVVAVHPPRPVRGGSGWAREQDRLHALVPRERTVVAGDFNAVDSHPSLRRFGRDGFRDSDDVVGAGWQPTYPAQGPIPPLIAIDHILLSPELTATSFRTVTMPGSDHRGVLATVALRG